MFCYSAYVSKVLSSSLLKSPRDPCGIVRSTNTPENTTTRSGRAGLRLRRRARRARRLSCLAVSFSIGPPDVNFSIVLEEEGADQRKKKDGTARQIPVSPSPPATSFEKAQAPSTRGPLVGAEMELHASLRPLFRDGYAVVDAHQMRHEAWGSPEGVAFIDSAGCAAPTAHQGGSHPAMR